MLNKKNRIDNPHVIETLFKKGTLYKSSLFTIKYSHTDTPPSRFALSVSKKLYKKAVQRNRLRRQLYEAIRLNLTNLKPSIIALIIAKPSCQKANYQDLSSEIQRFFKSLQTNAK